MEVRETSRITEAVNTARAGQIEEREARVTQLQAEVELLRAKRAVVGGFLQQREKEGLDYAHRKQVNAFDFTILVIRFMQAVLVAVLGGSAAAAS